MKAASTTRREDDRGTRRSRFPIWLLFLSFVIVLLVYLACAISLYRASRLAVSNDGASLLRATRLQPSNAEAFDRLGMYYMWQPQDLRSAEKEFQQGVRLNPFESSYWMHLAQAQDGLGDEPGLAYSLKRAVAADPTRPDVAWLAGNFQLLLGDTEEALNNLATVVQYDPARADAALEVSWRAVQRPDAILRRLPPKPDLYFRFLTVLVISQRWDAANHVWSALLALHRPYDPHQALFYVDALLANHDVAAAENVWQELTHSGRFQLYASPNNLIANPRFDSDLLNAGFGWRYAPQSGVTASFDQTELHASHPSLLLTFSGPNSDSGLYQYVVVKPGISYSVSAWVKSEDLETANGPYLAVCNGFEAVECAHSEETLGNTSWHQLQTTFTAGEHTNLVAVRFMRQPGNTHVSGKFWITDVQFAPVLSNPSRD